MLPTDEAEGAQAAIEAEPSAGSAGKRRALLVCNPNSSRFGEAMPTIGRLLADHGFEFDELRCSRADEVSPLIIARKAQCDRVIVCGGDGTLNAALRGLLVTGLPVGIVPLGTANDFARSVGLPAELTGALRIALGDRRREVDVGVVNEMPFLNVASVGLAAELASRLSRESKRRFGRLSYALAAVRLLSTAAPFHATLLTDGRSFMVKTFQIAVGNGRFYGGGNIIAPEAAVDDGRLQLYSLEFQQIWRMALMIRSFQSGRHGALSEVRTADGTSFEVITRKPKPINADGELLTETPARFSLKPRALTVFVGQDAPPAGRV